MNFTKHITWTLICCQAIFLGLGPGFHLLQHDTHTSCDHSHSILQVLNDLTDWGGERTYALSVVSEEKNHNSSDDLAWTYDSSSSWNFADCATCRFWNHSQGEEVFSPQLEREEVSEKYLLLSEDDAPSLQFGLYSARGPPA